MGARKVYIWRPTSSSSNQKAFQGICSAVDQLRANGRQKLQVQCIFTDVSQADQSTGAKRQFLAQVKFSDKLQEVHLVLESAGQVITANSSISDKGGLAETLGLQMNSPQRTGIKFEGIRFSMWDAAVFVAQATDLGGSREFLGVIVEIEYLPVSSQKVAAKLLTNLSQILTGKLEENGSLQGQLVGMSTDFSRFNLGDKFSRQHAGVNFAALGRALPKISKASSQT